jgi:hypothetical protein
MSGSHPTASGSPTFFFTTGYPINCHEYFVREMFPLETSRSEHLSSGIMKLHAKVVMEITFQIDLKDATKARQSLRRRQTCCVLLKRIEPLYFSLKWSVLLVFVNCITVTFELIYRKSCA